MEYSRGNSSRNEQHRMYHQLRNMACSPKFSASFHLKYIDASLEHTTTQNYYQYEVSKLQFAIK